MNRRIRGMAPLLVAFLCLPGERGEAMPPSPGWSTASGEVESAHRHVVQCRLKIAGAWWRPDTVGNVLALRMLKANGWWHEYWQSQRAAWKARAHGPPKELEHAEAA